MAPPSLCIVAGEPSGDLHGSLLTAEIRRRRPDWNIWGVGSECMARAGCDLWQDARDWGVIGFSSVLSSINQFRARLTGLTAEIEKRKPQAVILIDYPGFNLRLAARINDDAIGVMYYIVPQLWAWAPKRIKVFRRHIDRTVVAFSFEKKYFEERGVAADWVGHPLLDLVEPSAPRDTLRAQWGVDPECPLVTLLPGARRQDFRAHWPVFRAAVSRLQETIPDLRVALGLAPSVAGELGAGPTERSDLTVSPEVYDLVTASDLVITKTGTTTIECAILGTPMVTGYRMGRLNYAIAKRLVQVPYISMPNLIAGKEVVPELVQSDLTPDRIATESHRLLTDPGHRSAQIEALRLVREGLGEPGAPGRAADLVCEWVTSRS